MTSSVQLLNPNADVARRNLALQVNINAAMGLQGVLKSNLGPKGTLKMYVTTHGLNNSSKILLGL